MRRQDVLKPLGRMLLNETGPAITRAMDLIDAAKKLVAAAREATGETVEVSR